jgi:hypothetical protein
MIFCEAPRMVATQCLEYVKPSLFEPLPSAKKTLVGIPRHTLLLLYKAGLIRIVYAHMPGRYKPIELVHMPSLIGYLEREEEFAKNARLEKIRQSYAISQPNPNPESPHQKEAS